MRKLFTLLFICVFGVASSQITVTGIAPNNAERCSGPLQVVITGSGFTQFTNTSLTGILSHSNGSFISAPLSVSGGSNSTAFGNIVFNSGVTALGWHDLNIKNGNGNTISNTLSNAFEVLPTSTTATMILGNTQTSISSIETYSVSQVVGSTFNWFIDNSAGIILSGQGTNSIDIQWGNNNGTFEVCVVEMISQFNCPLDTLCLSVNVGSGSNIEEYNLTNKNLVKIIDALGRETNSSKKSKAPLFYIYEDGTVKRKQMIK